MVGYISPFLDLPLSCKLMELALNSAFFCQIDSVAYLVEHQTYNPMPGFKSYQRFGWWSKVLANLLNLISRNLGKTSMFLFMSASISAWVCHSVYPRWSVLWEQYSHDAI